MKKIELSLTLQSQAYEPYFQASLNDAGEDLGTASDMFAIIFQKDRPLPDSLRKDVGCDSCSTEVPMLGRVDTFSSSKLPYYFSDNRIFVHCPKRERLVEKYNQEDEVKDGMSDTSLLLQGQVEKTRRAFDAVQHLGCSGCFPVKVVYAESNSIAGIELKQDRESPYAVKRTVLSGDLLWGITNYIGKIEQKYDFADRLEVEDREAATAYLATKRLVNHLLVGHNKYTTFRDLDTPITLTLQDILSRIDGYDVLNNRSAMSYSTFFIAKEVVKLFIDQYEQNSKAELKDDYAYALKVKEELTKLKK